MDVVGLLLLLAAGLVVLVLALIVHSVWMLTHPPRRTYSWAVSRNLPGDPREASPAGVAGREVRFSEGTFGRGLPYWDIEGFEPGGPVVIVTHGWGDSRVTMLPRLEAFVQAARRVIIWEMPGHGEAAGCCRLGAGEMELLRELVEHVAEGEEVGRPGVVLYGFSLGAGLSVAAAAGDEAGRIAGVVAEAPYRTPMEPAWNLAKALHLPHRVNLPVAMTIMGALFAGDLRWGRRKPERVGGFDRAALAASVRVPLLVLHGSDDVICEPASGRAIAEAAPLGRFVEIPGGGHNDLWIVPERRGVMMEAVVGFLREAGRTSGNEERDRALAPPGDEAREPSGAQS